MLTAVHDSRDLTCRAPLGAQPCGTAVVLRLKATPGSACTLRVWIHNKETRYPMEDVSLEGLYEYSLILPEEPCLLWYSFEILYQDHVYWYGNAPDGLGGMGELCEGEGRSYQITVYDKAYVTPDWMREAVVYQIFCDRFFIGGENLLSRRKNIARHKRWNEQPLLFAPNITSWEDYPYDFFGGNLQGVEEKLPYLKELGVTCIYFNPMFKAQSNHKYDTGDYEQIDPTFGDNEGFIRLCRKARAMGIRVILDGVFSHTGEDSRYFNRYGHYDSVGACQSKDSPYYSWYEFEEYPNKYRGWWNFETLPEVDELNPTYMDFIIQGENAVAAQWIKRGAAGWRLDVADELPDPFIEALRTRIKKENPDSALIGEVWEDASNKISYGTRRTFAQGRSLDSVMNYPLREALVAWLTGKCDARHLARLIASLSENYPKAMFYSLMNLMGSHDRVRILNVLSGYPGEDLPKEQQRRFRLTKAQYDAAKQKLKAMFALICALPGMPTIYYGDEAGMQGGADPLCRGTYPWGSEDQDLIAWFKTCIEQRKAEPLWIHGELELFAPTPDVIGIGRGEPDADTFLLFMLNRSDAEITITRRGRPITLLPLIPQQRRMHR